MIKSLKIAAIVIAVLLVLPACKKCRNEDPRARVLNNGTSEVSVQIKTSGGNTENINNVLPGTVSEYRSYASGIVTFTIVVDKTNATIVQNVEMEECFEYDVILNANNTITTTPTDRND